MKVCVTTDKRKENNVCEPYEVNARINKLTAAEASVARPS